MLLLSSKKYYQENNRKLSEMLKELRKKSGNQQKTKNEKINIQNYSGKNQEIKNSKKPKNNNQESLRTCNFPENFCHYGFFFNYSSQYQFVITTKSKFKKSHHSQNITK